MGDTEDYWYWLLWLLIFIISHFTSLFGKLILQNVLHSICFGVHTHTHTCTTVQWPFVQDYPSRPVPEETFTHSHPSCSSDILYQLPPSATIHSILLVQFACLTVLFHIPFPGPLRSSSWSGALYFILHAFLHSVVIIFSQHLPMPSQPLE